MDDDLKIVLKIGTTIALIAFSGIGGCMYGYPQYNVYKQRMDGEAELAQAEYSKKVQVQDAEGKLAAASRLAQVEVLRANGVAQANKIIGDSLKDNEGYLRYLWINNLENNGKSPTVIYVPTEAGLPILEAGKRPN